MRKQTKEPPWCEPDVAVIYTCTYIYAKKRTQKRSNHPRRARHPRNNPIVLTIPRNARRTAPRPRPHQPLPHPRRQQPPIKLRISRQPRQPRELLDVVVVVVVNVALPHARALLVRGRLERDRARRRQRHAEVARRDDRARGGGAPEEVEARQQRAEGGDAGEDDGRVCFEGGPDEGGWRGRRVGRVVVQGDEGVEAEEGGDGCAVGWC